MKHRQTNTEATSRRDNQETHKSIEHGKAGITQKEDDTHNKNKEDKKPKIHRRHENKALAIVLVLFCLYVTGKCDVKNIRIPPGLRNCLRTRDDTFPFTDEQITTTCLLEFIWMNRQRCGRSRASSQTIDWLESLVRRQPVRASASFGGSGQPGPQPRTFATTNTLRQRKDYRMLTQAERNNYHQAIHMMKSDTRVSPNKYDAMAEHHRNTFRTAHGGVAFVGWHRYYLVLYELALQEQRPDVMLPYWDSSLDEALSDPTDSIIWTENFLGNGDGEVNTGPFGNFTEKISRSLHWDKSLLINKDDIERLIVNSPSQRSFVLALESFHNGPHVWVGGTMSGVDSAPFDPVFYMHHAYIDCIWERYRDYEKQNSRDPENYPPAQSFFHRAERDMINLPELNNEQLKNLDGYKNFWTETYYTCALPPTCNLSSPNCGSDWLECDIFNSRCVSKTSAAAEPQVTNAQILQVGQAMSQGTFLPRGAMTPSVMGIPALPSAGPTTSSLGFDRRRTPTRKDFFDVLKSLTSSSVPRSSSAALRALPASSQSISPFNSFVGDLKIPDAEKTCVGKPIQNTFSLDCRQGTDLWGYIPIKVVYLGHGNVIYSSHPVDLQGNIDNRTDIFSIGQRLNFTNNMRSGIRSRNTNCRYDESGLMKVRITSYGLNYEGIYEDYVFLDNRRSVWTEVTYIAVKRPTRSASKIFVTAIDECQIACQPMVLARRRRYAYPRYKLSSGAVEVTPSDPKFFSTTYREAEAQVWSTTRSKVPYEDDNNIPIVFYCDYREKNPWS